MISSVGLQSQSLYKRKTKVGDVCPINRYQKQRFRCYICSLFCCFISQSVFFDLTSSLFGSSLHQSASCPCCSSIVISTVAASSLLSGAVREEDTLKKEDTFPIEHLRSSLVEDSRESTGIENDEIILHEKNNSNKDDISFRGESEESSPNQLETSTLFSRLMASVFILISSLLGVFCPQIIQKYDEWSKRRKNSSSTVNIKNNNISRTPLSTYTNLEASIPINDALGVNINNSDNATTMEETTSLFGTKTKSNDININDKNDNGSDAGVESFLCCFFECQSTAKILKMVAAGVILGVAFIHVLADAIEKLESAELPSTWSSNLKDYPFGFVIALMGTYVILIFETLSAYVAQGKNQKYYKSCEVQDDILSDGIGSRSLNDNFKFSIQHSQQCGKNEECTPLATNFTKNDYKSIGYDKKNIRTRKDEFKHRYNHSDGEIIMNNNPTHTTITTTKTNDSNNKNNNDHNDHVEEKDTLSGKNISCPPYGESEGMKGEKQHRRSQTLFPTSRSRESLFSEEDCEAHHVVCTSHHVNDHIPSLDNYQANAALIVTGYTKKSLSVAAILELGMVFHSLLIGFGLGVITDSVSTVNNLLIALSFHQFFEGIGLGICLDEAGLSSNKKIIMLTTFSISAPVGVLFGIGISSLYNPESNVAKWTEGLLNAFCAGILIHLGLVDLIAVEFNDQKVQTNLGLICQMLFGLFLGTGIMAVMALWV